MKKLQPILLLFAFALCTHAQQYVITDLRARGSSRFKEEDILRASGIEKSKRAVPLAEVKSAASKLLGLGPFKEVSYLHAAAPGGMKVEFTVKDADLFVRADFDNIVWLPEKELIAAIQKQVPLFYGELPISGSLQQDVSAALQSVLAIKGVTGSISYEPHGPREGVVEAIAYSVDDVEVKIGQINFSGVSPSFSQPLEAVAKDLFGTHYQRSTLRKFTATNLRDVYRRKGFLNAVFAEPLITVTSIPGDATVVSVALLVKEGRAYNFAGITWAGNQAKTADELTRTIRGRSGETLNAVQLDEDLTRIRTAYATLGYMHMFLEVEPIFQEDAGTVAYLAKVNEGDLFSMGKLDIAGLQLQSAERVRQQWRLREGDPYNPGYVAGFFSQFQLPPGVAYVVEQNEGERTNSIDLTLVFCKANEKCLASAPNQLFIPDTGPERPEPRRRGPRKK